MEKLKTVLSLKCHFLLKKLFMNDANRESENLFDIEKRVITHADTQFEMTYRSNCCLCCKLKKLKSEQEQIPVVLEDLTPANKLIVLDLDETLVHCSFHPTDYYDFCISIIIDEVSYDVYIQKRPYVDQFLAECFKHFFVVIFTASLPQYANPIIDVLCPHLPQSQRLFRESCTFCEGLFVKDLTIFKAPLERIIIVDNNPCSFLMHPANAILSLTWEGDRNDWELRDYILPLLKQCENVKDVRKVLAENKRNT